MHQTLATTPADHIQIPCQRLFLVLERSCRIVATPGGRIFVLLFLVIAGYTGAAFGIRSAESGGAAALIALLLVLARHPASPGVLGAVMALLNK